MAIIYKTKNFILESHERPEIDRLEGGHIKISARKNIADRTGLTARQAVELMRLTMVAGEAMKKGMRKSGVRIGRINYQDNGNWTPRLHIHLYGRAINARKQKYGEPFRPGHRKDFHPLNKEDMENIRNEIEKIFKTEKFSDKTWGIF